MGEAARLDQVLVDAHGVAPELHLGLDPLAVLGTGRDRGRRRYRRYRGSRRGLRRSCDRHWREGSFLSRWPEWRSFLRQPLRAGGRGGGFCGPRVAPNGLAVDAGASLDLALARAGLEQRFDRRTQMRLQDIHSFLPFVLVGGGVYVPPPGAYPRAPLALSGWGILGWPRVGDFGWSPGASKESSEAPKQPS